uniref:PDZ domain-containing protein n=1 Tax=Steinernema glaseri TaxID=37863 RepID=A0A1I7Z5T9_9BILA
MNRLSINNRRGRSMNRRSRNRRRRSQMRSAPIQFTESPVAPGQDPFDFEESSRTGPTIEEISDSKAIEAAPERLAIEAASEPTKLVFQCQLAHGSPTGLVEGVNSIGELYSAIASCFPDIKADDILFCTLNSPAVNMDNLISSSLPVDKFIFAHIRGQKKEVRLEKAETQLGLTITDNGEGKSFIKRIREGSVSAMAQPALAVGDYVTSINGVSMEGKRHFEVARVLRSIPVGQEFVIRLVSPLKSGFNFIAPRSGRGVASRPSNGALGSGTQTLRFKANGSAVLQEAPSNEIVDLMNDVFDRYLGLNDDDLALTVWEIGVTCEDLLDMEDKIRNSPIGSIGFPDELVFDMWGIVQDYKKKLEANKKIVEMRSSAEFADDERTY